MTNRWLDWMPETQVISEAPETQPAKPAKTGPLAVALSVSDCTPIIAIVEPKVPVSQASRGRLRYLAGSWLREQCVVTRLCASSLRALGRSFFQWAKLSPDAAVEQSFAEELLQRGFAADEAGFVYGLVLTEDLATALKYERAPYQAQVRSIGIGRRWK